jgi:hypothetical protein
MTSSYVLGEFIPSSYNYWPSDMSSQQIGAPTIAFVDQQARVFRIMRVPALKSGENSLAHSPAQSSSSRRSSTAIKTPTPTYKAKARARKVKVPRPPNAFILYRQERHPLLKLEHPEYHNNDICKFAWPFSVKKSCTNLMPAVILGKRWKSEPDEVKAHYKQLADEIKAKHMQEHPDYQYAPRKPSEKKRRMTARRAAELAQVEDMSFIDLGSDEDVSEASSPAIADVHDILGISRPKPLNQFAKDQDGNIAFTLPTHKTQDLHGMINAHNNYLSTMGLPFDPANQYQLSSSIPTYVQNDQDFVDSLVDWDGIAADVALVRDASAEEMAQLEGVELGNSYLSLSGEDHRALFEAELERTMRYFK